MVLPVHEVDSVVESVGCSVVKLLPLVVEVRWYGPPFSLNKLE
jgi:hypothetical protein